MVVFAVAMWAAPANRCKLRDVEPLIVTAKH
jgi:hypothetical protein